jgi:hypothetical protein
VTSYAIFLFALSAWYAQGSFYAAPIVFVVVVFLAWVYRRITNPLSPSEDMLLGRRWDGFQLMAWASVFMLILTPPLELISDSLQYPYWFYRFMPIGIMLLPFRFQPAGILLFFFTVLLIFPNPGIDVFISNSRAVDFFVHGVNPYSQTYPDIYHGVFNYRPGFLYWPGALYFQTLSKEVFGDVRAVLVMAWWAGAFFFPKSNSAWQGLRRIWWLLPFITLGLDKGWLDPLISFAAAAALWSIQYKRWWCLAMAIALAASIKQYGFIVGLFPLVMFMLDREWKLFFKVGIAAALLFLLLLGPFLIWDFPGFFSMTVANHWSTAPRTDALNFTALWINATGKPFPAVAQLGMTLLGFGLAFFHLMKNRGRGALTVIAESWAIAFGFSMLFGKFAFCNYYWLLISFMILSLAFSHERKPERISLEGT